MRARRVTSLKKVFVTGTAGFIGYHLAKKLLAEGFIVNGFDGMTNYYDVELKKRRHQMLLDHDNFSCTIGMLEDGKCLEEAFDRFSPDAVVHLAAQAGVRYSLEESSSLYR